MLDTFRGLIANQYEAAFCTLRTCMDMCPDSAWNTRVCNYPFCQVAFHTLFFADYYLEPDENSFRDQPFHRENKNFFADYEQLEDREPISVYERAPINAYLQHCRTKASRVIATETADTLIAATEFQRREFSRAELHVYNVRHIQHHSPQMSLRLRIDAGTNVPWIGSGWREV